MRHHDPADETPRSVTEGRPGAGVVAVVLVPGQEADLTSAARALLAWEPLFTESLRRLWSHLRELRPDIAELATALDDPVRLSRGERHALHAGIVLAMIDQLRDRGLPDAVFLGNSLGEYAAAAAAGAVGTDVVLPLLIDRGRVLDDAPGGRMFAVRAPADELSSALPELGPPALVSENRVVHGVAAHEADAVLRRLDHLGIPYVEVDVDRPYHSSHLDGAAAEFAPTARAAAPARHPRWVPTLALVGDLETYWERHLRQPVDLRPIGRTVAALSRSSRCVVVDLGTDGSLGRPAERAAPVPVVRPWAASDEPRATYLRALAELGATGIGVTLPPGAHL